MIVTTKAVMTMIRTASNSRAVNPLHRSAGKKYEPPSTTIEASLATATGNSLVPDSGKPPMARVTLSVESLGAVMNATTTQSGSIIIDNEPKVTTGYCASKEPDATTGHCATHNPKVTTGHCDTDEYWELEYNSEQFRRIENERKTFYKRLSSFSQRWKSFRDDQRSSTSRQSNLQKKNREGDNDEILPSVGLASSNGYSNNEEDDLTEDNNKDDRFSGVYQPFGRLFRGGKKAKSRANQNLPDRCPLPSSPDALFMTILLLLLRFAFRESPLSDRKSPTQ